MLRLLPHVTIFVHSLPPCCSFLRSAFPLTFYRIYYTFLVILNCMILVHLVIFLQSFLLIIFSFWRNNPHWARTSSLKRFQDHTQRRTTVGRTPLEEWSARRRGLYLTTHNTQRQTSMPPVGFEPTISADERPQTHALDRAVTGTGSAHFYLTTHFPVFPFAFSRGGRAIFSKCCLMWYNMAAFANSDWGKKQEPPGQDLNSGNTEARQKSYTAKFVIFVAENLNTNVRATKSSHCIITQTKS